MKHIFTILFLLNASSVFAESEYHPAFHKADLKNSQELQTSLRSDLKKLHSLFFAEKKIPTSLVTVAEDHLKKPSQNSQIR